MMSFTGIMAERFTSMPICPQRNCQVHFRLSNLIRLKLLLILILVLFSPTEARPILDLLAKPIEAITGVVGQVTGKGKSSDSSSGSGKGN